MKEQPSHNERTSVKTRVCKLTTDLQLESDEMDLDHFLALPLSVRFISKLGQIKLKVVLFCFFVLCFMLGFFPVFLSIVLLKPDLVLGPQSVSLGLFLSPWNWQVIEKKLLLPT